MSEKTGWKTIKQQLPSDVLIDWMMSKKNCERCKANIGDTKECPVCQAERDSTLIEVKKKPYPRDEDWEEGITN